MFKIYRWYSGDAIFCQSKPAVFSSQLFMNRPAILDDAVDLDLFSMGLLIPKALNVNGSTTRTLSFTCGPAEYVCQSCHIPDRLGTANLLFYSSTLSPQRIVERSVHQLHVQIQTFDIGGWIRGGRHTEKNQQQYHLLIIGFFPQDLATDSPRLAARDDPPH
ncbi:hypothetical protein MVEN_00419000 [Mycena venus]|uniref:Uncharacterized protein n=1 Tax=Mycena venus TaxID=2733690 RepID=A0A8H6YQN2_9AGAR|nr:hypothetical protein MVEN_00419000 [Mycena venus]